MEPLFENKSKKVKFSAEQVALLNELYSSWQTYDDLKDDIDESFLEKMYAVGNDLSKGVTTYDLESLEALDAIFDFVNNDRSSEHLRDDKMYKLWSKISNVLKR